MNDTAVKRIRKYIDDTGIKQTVISRKIGMKSQTLSDILCEKRKLHSDEIELLCWVLGKTPNDFLKPRAPEKVGA
jgi:antitoxin component HigA of HigAB toxin-antitoxin module